MKVNLKIPITDPVVKRVMAKKDAAINKVGRNRAGIPQTEIIRARNDREAEKLLNNFYANMHRRYNNFHVINVTVTPVFTGFMYTITYEV